MGEYARRKSDNVEVKIGTCEDMLYLRYEDRDKVTPIDGNLDPVKESGILRFRLPFPDEDDVPIGQYKDPFRGVRLYRQCGVGQSSYCEDFKDESAVHDWGSIQLTHPSGLLVNVPCYHGIKLPEESKDFKPFWNGKSWSFELTQLAPRTIDGVLKVLPIVKCRHCRGLWRYEWSTVWEYVPADLKRALRVYAEPDIPQTSQAADAEASGYPLF